MPDPAPTLEKESDNRISYNQILKEKPIAFLLDIIPTGTPWPQQYNQNFFMVLLDAMAEEERFSGLCCVEISIVLADNAYIRQLNAQYRHQDKPTNVLSFPQHSPNTIGEANPQNRLAPIILGDIVFAHETIAKEATELEKNFSDHLAHLFVHGILHLLGYDHQTDEEAELMEKREQEILAKVASAHSAVTKS